MEKEPEKEEISKSSISDEKKEDEGKEGDYFTSKITIDKRVVSFISGLDKALTERKKLRISELFTKEFEKISEELFKEEPWPDEDLIRQIKQTSLKEITLLIYKELRFRHIYSKLSISEEQKKEAHRNYIKLFEELKDNENIKLPGEILWEIMQEFTYQFLANCRNYSKAFQENNSQHPLNIATSSLTQKDEFEHPLIAYDLSDVYNVFSVFSSEIIHASTIIQNHTHDIDYYAYFALICQIRILVSLQDYWAALEIINLFTQAQLQNVEKISDAYLTLLYFAGYTFLVTNQISKAIHSFTLFQIYVTSKKQYTKGHDTVFKKNEQVLSLLSICAAISSEPLETKMQSILKEHTKYKDAIYEMESGNIQKFEELFNYGSPWFISLPFPITDEILTHNEILKNQSKRFISQIKRMMILPLIRSYLKYYKNITTAKLGRLLEIEEDEVKYALMNLKNMEYQMYSKDGLHFEDFEWKSFCVPEFYMEGDNVIIAEVIQHDKMQNNFLSLNHQLMTQKNTFTS